jgi:hypothetical protein
MCTSLNFSDEIAGLTEMAERQHAIHLRNTRSLVNDCKELLQKKKEEIEAYKFECEELMTRAGARLDEREEALKKREQYVIEGETALQERTRAIVQKERELYEREQALKEREQAFDAKISRARETFESVLAFESPKTQNDSHTEFVPVDLSTTTDGYDEPVCGAFLQGYVRPEGKRHGNPLIFKTFEEAVRAANDLGDSCAGIRMEPDDKRYTLQTGTYYGRKTGLVKPDEHNKRYRPNWVTWCKLSPNVLIPAPKPTPAPTTNTPYATANESEEEEDLHVTTWDYNGTTYLVDENTNVYDVNTEDLIGQRVGDKLAKF